MKKNIREFSFKESSISIGVVAGVIIGATTENIGLWLPLGIALGVAVGLWYGKKS
tara:strand:+ start:1182 stop:1346 length:165 start_codon:yes stop_codon:yes gene_type:complete